MSLTNFLTLNGFMDKFFSVISMDLINLTYVHCDQKKLPKVYKSCPKMISLEKMIDFDKNCLRMCEIWAKKMLPKSLKSCPKSKNSPNLVTLLTCLFNVSILIKDIPFPLQMNQKKTTLPTSSG